MKRKLVDHLVNSGVVQRNEVQRCVLRASMNEGSVVDEMTERIAVDQRELAAAMAEFWGIEFWDRSFDAKNSELHLISQAQARSFGVLPIGGQDGQEILRLAVYDVEKAQPIIEKIRKKTGVSPTLVMAPRKLVEEEVRRHYGKGGSEDPNAHLKKSTKSGHGVVNRKRSRGTRPPRMTRAPSQPEGTQTPDEDVVNVNDAQPTRQVELVEDNPFMDLVRETTPDKSAPRGTPDQPKTRIIGDGSQDFFDDFGGGFDDDDDFDGEIGDFSEALEEFDAQLTAEIEAEEEDIPPLLSTSSSVNWGEFGDDPSDNGGAAARSPFHQADTVRSNVVTEESAIFPVDRDQSGFFDFPDEDDDDQLTLAEVVERQRKIIDKLEREINYQKGILQTMAELLVEARVLSRRKLKSRLKAFKKEQRQKDK